MDVVLVEKKNRRDWDVFVQESPGVIAWHSYSWEEVLQQYYGTEFYPLAVYDGPKICGILPLYRIKTLRGEALLSSPHFVAGGIVASDEDVRDALLKKAIDFANQLKIFFFSSRRRHTRFDCDWSSDVCSSD